jgi:oxalate decarboxylase
MSKEFSRRGLFQAAPLGAAAFLAPQHANAQEQPAAIPSLKFDIEAQTHWKGEAGSANEATVAEFPISQSIAGVSMRLKPGAIRELHWHALAAEWAYMIEGRVRTTVVMPNGQSAIDEFGP